MSDTTSTTTDTTQDQAPQDQAPDTTTTTEDKGPDLAKVVADLQAQVQALTAKNQEAERLAEEAKRASMTEAERLAADRAALDVEKAQVQKAKRDAALDKLNVLPAYRDLVPADLDAAGLETWVKARPEIIQKKAEPSNTYTPPPKSRVAQILSGEVSHPLFSAESLRKMLGN